MIPKEKIEQAANDTNPFTYEKSDPKIAYRIGFRSGVRFAEEEMKQRAQEFAEWVEINCSAVSGRLWEFIKDPNSELFTSAELYAKFEAEMNQQNNGG